jgi:hypothetical protein
VLAFAFLIVGLLCAIVGRILLIGAAFQISVWWGLGVFLPFGPLLFRLSYPDAAERSRIFRLATLPCLFFYFLLGPGSGPLAYYRYKIKHPRPPSSVATGYALEKAKQSATVKVELKPSLAERQAVNNAEFERLRAWSEKLRLQKRDLLHSDEEGNRAYNLELAQYNAALEKASAEKASLAGPIK